MPRICEPINGIKYMITNPDDFIQETLINGKQHNNDIFNIIKTNLNHHLSSIYHLQERLEVQLPF